MQARDATGNQCGILASEDQEKSSSRRSSNWPTSFNGLALLANLAMPIEIRHSDGDLEGEEIEK